MSFILVSHPAGTMMSLSAKTMYFRDGFPRAFVAARFLPLATPTFSKVVVVTELGTDLKNSAVPSCDPFDLRGQGEVLVGQSAGVVGRQRHRDARVGQQHVRMVAGLLGEIGNPRVREALGLAEATT